jgi:hypothetical protein
MADMGEAAFAEEYDINYLETEENVMAKELSASQLAQYMMDSKPVNVPKYTPILARQFR